MPRPLRFVPPKSLIEITCRTQHGRHLLRPDDMFVAIVIGILARAQGLTGMCIHAFVFLSNHFHILLSPDDAHQLARFMCFLNSNLAREGGRRYDWRERFFGRRYRSIPVSGEDVAQVARLKYLLSQGCKEGLVSRPIDWPGAHCIHTLLHGAPLEGLWFDRTREFRARRRGVAFEPLEFATRESVQLTPLPCWSHLQEDEVRTLVADLIREIEQEARDQQEETGRAPLGAAFIRRQDPHSKPVGWKARTAPRVHAATRAARRALIDAYREFQGAYRRAAARLAQGDLLANFPEGSFPPPLPFARGPARLPSR